jgi:hypothetical protein
MRTVTRTIKAVGSSQLALEESEPAGAVGERPAAPDPPDLVASQPAEAVVAEQKIEEGVGLGSADERSGVRRPQLDESDEPAARDEDRGRGAGDMDEPAGHGGRRRNEVDEGERGDDEERLEHLRKEGKSDRDAGDGEPACRRAVNCAGGGVGRNNEQENQKRVRVVEPEHQRGDGGQCQRCAGDEPAEMADGAADGQVQHPDARDAHQRLGDEHAPRAQPEEPDAEGHDPERCGGLVDCQRVAGIERSEQEREPILRAGQGRSRVIRVRPARCAEVPEIEQGRTADESELGETQAQRARQARRGDRRARVRDDGL